MINLILTLSLSAVNPTSATQTAQFRPCVWPNVCTTIEAPVQTAQFRPCVWPNVCRNEAPLPVLELKPVEVAQFTTCVLPRKCANNS